MSAYIISKFFELVFLMMFLKILLSWFPNINWQNQPFKLLKSITDPIFEPFRRFIPPVGMLDLSPIVAFIVIGLVRNVAVTLALQF